MFLGLLLLVLMLTLVILSLEDALENIPGPEVHVDNDDLGNIPEGPSDTLEIKEAQNLHHQNMEEVHAEVELRPW